MKQNYFFNFYIIILLLLGSNLVVFSQAPLVTSFSPSSGCQGSTSVIISGANFTGATVVEFGGMSAQSFVVNNANQITAIPSSGNSGVISVTTAFGTGSSAATFTVNAATPIPNPVTATPQIICAGGNTNLNAVSAGNTINWYTVPNGGVNIGTSQSGVNFNVTPAVTTTYYAESQSIAVGPPVTTTFNYTGSPQSFTVPLGVTSVMVQAWGAQGGANAMGAVGGLGGLASGTMVVNAGDVLNIYVGGMGIAPVSVNSLTGGYNGGGSGGITSAINFNPRGGGGGGASDVRVSGVALNNRVIVGAGGGGAGGNRITGIGRGTGGGGGGGYYGGGGGSGWPGSVAGWTMPTGGSQAAGGLGGISTYTVNNNNGFPGSLGTGGNGGPEINSNQGGTATGSTGGTGGGAVGSAGLYVSGSFTGASGAGGSSNTAGVAGGSTTAGVRVGHGQVSLTYNSVIAGCPSISRVPVTVTVNPLPLITANASPAIVCDGSQTTLTGNGANTYAWTGGVINGVAFTPVVSAIYTVTGTDVNGCTSTSSVSIAVNPLNTGTGSASPSTICLGNTTTISATALPSCSGNISNFAGYYAPANWAFSVTNSNGTVNTAGAPANIIISSGTNLSGTPGITRYSRTVGCNGNVTFNWSYTHADAFGSIFDYPRYTINGGAPVTFSAFIIGGANTQSGSQTIPVSVGDVLELQMYTIDNDNIAGFTTINTFSAPNLGYTGTVSIWDAAVGGNNLGASPAVVIPATAGTVNYYVEVTSNGPGNCVNPTRIAIPVMVNSFPNLMASASPAAICPGNSTVLTGANGNSYLWNPGALTGSPTVTPAITTTYTVTGTDANGCTATSTVEVVVNGLPVVTAAPATQTVCEMGMATVSGGGAATYAWTGGITDATPFMVMAPAVYTVTGTDANGCINTATAEVLMNALPVITAGATPATTCEMTTVTPSASGAITIGWSGGLTNNVPFVATATTTYTVTGTDGNGCTNSTTVLVSVNPMSGILAPATSNQSQDHGDDFDINYYAGNCDLIATVDDGAGGNVLGMTTSTVNVDATAGMHNGQPFVRRWYQITPTTNGAADVVLYINQSDFDDYNAAVLLPYLPLPIIGNNADPNIANIRITKNADAGLGNSPVVITPTVNWNGTYWELSFNTPNFSQFRVHSVNPGNVPLPVTITHFSGLKLETSDKLSWTTSSEQNNASFNLQHSTDGIHFTTLTKVNSKAANGNSATPLTYTHSNTNPKMGHNYYRLQQTDLDNKLSVHAQIVDLIWGANGSTVSIYPNPTTDILNIDLYAATAQNTTVKLLDMSGRVIKQIQAKSAVGMNHIKLSMGEIASGVYTIQVYENNTLSHTSKVKKND